MSEHVWLALIDAGEMVGCAWAVAFVVWVGYKYGD